jgi:hypothetical protein
VGKVEADSDRKISETTRRQEMRSGAGFTQSLARGIDMAEYGVKEEHGAPWQRQCKQRQSGNGFGEQPWSSVEADRRCCGYTKPKLAS